MTAHLQMDEQGRVLIPQELREALGLRPGETLDAEVEGGRLVLRPQAAEAELVEFEGRLVIKTAQPVKADTDFVEEMRQQRLRDLLDL
ncbi:AbrB/MazE/SpoVT family DNA-binding domain-containing protein [Deinococcus planocerae]|uniref:AbrB/MazE/SpoVT family DNA-binding domain-containing protein n=1 Tax=Deinococcus planocerae TaxID=1737569 RepID=UPI000C7EBE3E|nr:AbrB/MazE/SpoVT family DNA-binding domain-containing protein [Deinococcus planocerae]